MNHIWKRSIWAALLTMATLFAAGCSDDNGTNSANQSAVPAITAANGSSAVVSDTFVYTMNEDNTITITDYTGDAEILMIPDTIYGFAVTKIGDHAFEANWNLTSVTLPNGLISIEESAFIDCGNLATVIIPESVSTIRRAAFASCSSLTELTLPASVSTVEEEAFTGCGSLTNLTIQNPTLAYSQWWSAGETIPATITCPSGSTIEQWATENGVATQPLS